jgi:geranylgeranyl pyrophosphate synthase
MFWITDLFSSKTISSVFTFIIAIVGIFQLLWMLFTFHWHSTRSIYTYKPTHKVSFYKHLIDHIIAEESARVFSADKIGAECTRVLTSGKRLRSAIYMDIVLRSKNKVSDHLINDSVMSIESLHASSLIVDDLPLFDNSDTRRGKPTTHKKYDVKLANLCAATLISTAMYKTKHKYIANDAVYKLCVGQYSENDMDVDMNMVIDNKTGSLFEYAAALAIRDADINTYKNYEINNDLLEAMKCLGRAYQIKDDGDDMLTDTNRNYASTHPNWKEDLEFNIQMCNMYLVRSGFDSPLFHDIYSMLKN